MWCFLPSNSGHEFLSPHQGGSNEVHVKQCMRGWLKALTQTQTLGRAVYLGRLQETAPPAVLGTLGDIGWGSLEPDNSLTLNPGENNQPTNQSGKNISF